MSAPTPSASTSAELPWQRIGREKRQSVHALLPENWRVKVVPTAAELPDATAFPRSLLSEHELAITEDNTADQLVQQLAAGSFSAVEVTSAFCHRATIAHQLVSLTNTSRV